MTKNLLPIFVLLIICTQSSLGSSTSDIKFHLYTRQNPSVPDQLLLDNRQSIRNSHFNPRLPTRFEIHGWRVQNNPDWNVRAKYLEKGRFNVIYVDWSTISTPISVYEDVIAEVPFVSATIAQLIRNLFKAGAKSKDMVLVGDKLGAHVAGFTGKNLTQRWRPSSIVGLDGAGRYYSEAGPSGRLAPGDADYVMFVHTNVGGWGTRGVVGDMDLFLYGGKLQPGCNETDTNCSHERAYGYFAYSITGGGFQGWPCASEALLADCRASATSVLVKSEPLNRRIKGIYYGEMNGEFFETL